MVLDSDSNKVETGLARKKIGMSTNSVIFLEYSPATNTYIPVSRTLNEGVWHRETILDFNMATKRFIPMIAIQEAVDMQKVQPPEPLMVLSRDEFPKEFREEADKFQKKLIFIIDSFDKGLFALPDKGFFTHGMKWAFIQENNRPSKTVL